MPLNKEAKPNQTKQMILCQIFSCRIQLIDKFSHVYSSEWLNFIQKIIDMNYFPYEKITAKKDPWTCEILQWKA